MAFLLHIVDLHAEVLEVSFHEDAVVAAELSVLLSQASIEEPRTNRIRKVKNAACLR